MKIFVKPNFKQLDGDVVLYSTTEFIAVEVRDAALYADYVVEVDAAVVEEFETSFLKKQKDEMSKAIQKMLDSKAKEYRYENMMSVRSYTGYQNYFQAEALALATWASACWIKAGQIEFMVANGDMEAPSIEELLAEMPEYIENKGVENGTS